MPASQAWQGWIVAPLLGVAIAASCPTGATVPEPCGDGKTVLADPQLYACARQTAVKIVNGQSWGSGTIVWRQGNRHGILTNAHVLRAAEAPAYYCVQTADRRVHLAVVLTAARFPETDLALLEFRSSTAYASIRFSTETSLLQQEVVAVGFPHSGAIGVVTAEDGFAFERGTVRRLLERPLRDGYQIGYDGRVEKGMSGGAVLGPDGAAIAIGGWHADPLWIQAFAYQDGSPLNPQLQTDLARLNWGIPIQKFWQVPQALSIASAPPPPANGSACASGESARSMGVTPANPK